MPLMMAVLFPLLSACAVPEVSVLPAKETPSGFLRPRLTTFSQLPGWKTDNLSEALPAFLRSCEKLRALPPDRTLKPKMVPSRVSDWLPLCDGAARVYGKSQTEVRYFFETHFSPYIAQNDYTSQGLFTGYYEAELRGAWRPDPVHRYPIYARPKDLVSVDLGTFRDKWKGETLAGRIVNNKITPYPTRAEINAGILKGKQLELLWVDSAIDAFFLHIQGSGRVVLPDGSTARIGYAGRNGRRYTPIGRELVARGVMDSDAVTLESIQAWLAANPLAGTELMDKNQSYIFFRIIDGNGPIGAQGVPLTAGRSLAVDRNHIPLGIPIWLNTTEPGKSKKPLRRLVIAQDTGSAIKGPVRGDLFVGHGRAAGIIAGRMKQPGTYYLLLPK